MKLPLIKSLVEYSQERDTKAIEIAIEVLEHLGQARGLKEHEEEVIGEILSNMFGALEVSNMISEGTPTKDALNSFMKRVQGSVD